jgi:gas vesicle protein
MSQQENGGNGAALLGVAVAAAIGAALGLVLAPKSGKQLRKEIAKQATTLAKKFGKTRNQVQEIVYSTFGKVNNELEQNYIEIRAQVLAMIEQLGAKSKLTQKKYHAIVEEAVASYSKAKKWTESVVKKLVEDLKSEWEAIKEGNK